MIINISKAQTRLIDNKLNILSKDDIYNKVIFKIANRLETQTKLNISKLIFKKSTGKLLQSVSIKQKNKLEAQVLVGAKYGLFVNRGTGIFIGRKPWITNFGGVLPHAIRMKGFKPRPFWDEAVKKVKEESKTIISTTIKKYVN